MAREKPIDWRVMVWAGIADMAIGIGLAAAALVGALGEGNETVLTAVGGLLVLSGLFIFVWGRNNLSKAGDRRGDLN